MTYLCMYMVSLIAVRRTVCMHGSIINQPIYESACLAANSMRYWVLAHANALTYTYVYYIAVLQCGWHELMDPA